MSDELGGHAKNQLYEARTMALIAKARSERKFTPGEEALVEYLTITFSMLDEFRTVESALQADVRKLTAANIDLMQQNARLRARLERKLA